MLEITAASLANIIAIIPLKHVWYGDAEKKIKKHKFMQQIFFSACKLYITSPVYTLKDNCLYYLNKTVVEKN